MAFSEPKETASVTHSRAVESQSGKRKDGRVSARNKSLTSFGLRGSAGLAHQFSTCPGKIREEGAREMGSVLKPGGRVLVVGFLRSRALGLLGLFTRSCGRDVADLEDSA